MSESEQIMKAINELHQTLRLMREDGLKAHGEGMAVAREGLDNQNRWITGQGWAAQTAEHGKAISPEEETRRSFVYGNVKLHNPATTREDIDRAAEVIQAERDASPDHITQSRKMVGGASVPVRPTEPPTGGTVAAELAKLADELNRVFDGRHSTPEWALTREIISDLRRLASRAGTTGKVRIVVPDYWSLSNITGDILRLNPDVEIVTRGAAAGENQS